MNNHPQAGDPGPTGGTGPISGQPWSTPSGDSMSTDPFRPANPYQAAPEYPPTSQFPATPGGPADYPGPVNYAPPGHSPDYGQGYPPPGYPASPPFHPGAPGGPPGPPLRKSNVPLVAVIVAVSLLLCGGAATATVLAVRAATDKTKEAADQAREAVPDLPTIKPELPGLPTDLPGLPTDLPGTGRKLTVTYEVRGDGPAQVVYVDKLGGTPTRLNSVKLPWKVSVEVETPTMLSVIAVRSEPTDGTISCRALVDGKVVKEHKASGGMFSTASCTHFALGN